MSGKIATSERWYDLCERMGIPKIVARDNLAKMIIQYGEGHRAYHNWDHIDFVLKTLDLNRKLANNFDLVEAAAWKHDVFMVTRRRPRGLPTNEALSAAQLDDMLALSGKSFELRTDAFGLVHATLHKEGIARTPDEMLLTDIDWSPLGWDWELYIENRERIRKEYGHLSDKEFQNGRFQWVLKSCRRKSHSYLPEFKRFDAQVQANLTRELNEFRLL